MTSKLIKANKDGNVLIKESDKGFFHVELTRLTVVPGDEKHPQEFSYVQCFDEQTFKRFFDTGKQKENRRFLNVMNVDSARVVHDPRKAESPAAAAKNAKKDPES